MFRLTSISKLILRNAQIYKSVANQVKTTQNFVHNYGRFNQNNNNLKVRKFEVPEIEQDPKQTDELDKDYIAAQDPDSFGTLSVNVQKADHKLVDEGDIQEEEYSKYRPSKSRKLSTKQYADMIKDHLKNNRIKEAIDVVEVRMIQEDRVKPENYIYNLLIGGCARVGYSKKAFQLYNKMKQRGLKITGGTYTSLFNACANAPFINDGLEKANRLREIMIEKGYEPNVSNYNAMIKAYGRLGEVKTAFQLVDEMITKELHLNTDTFNFVLQACASDKEMGFRHALLVWHKMYRRKLAPDIFSFNLMLRCCRDTNIGDVETAEEVIKTILLSNPDERRRLGKQGLLEGTQEQKSQSTESDISSVNREEVLDSAVSIEFLNSAPTELKPYDDPTPNLLTVKPRLGNLIQINEIKRPEDRLLLLGGMSGFLGVMEDFKVTPNIKTYTELLEVIPPTQVAEKKLIATIRKAGMKCDIDFFNTLIKKRSMRFDYQSAKEVMSMIKTARLEPDIVTYGVLSLGCQTIEEAQELLDTMRENGVRMNMHILGAMLRQGTLKMNFPYILEILKIVKDFKLKPNEKFLTHLENFQISCKKLKRSRKEFTDKQFRIELNSFHQKLNCWKEEMGLDDLSNEEAKKLVREHPWEQFQEPQAEGYEDVKNPSLRKKKKKFHNLKKIKIEDESLSEIEQKKIGQ